MGNIDAIITGLSLTLIYLQIQILRVMGLSSLVPMSNLASS